MQAKQSMLSVAHREAQYVHLQYCFTLLFAASQYISQSV